MNQKAFVGDNIPLGEEGGGEGGEDAGEGFMCEGDKERLVRGSRPTAIQGGWGGGELESNCRIVPPCRPPPSPLSTKQPSPSASSLLLFLLSAKSVIQFFFVYIAGCIYTSLCTCMYVLGYKQSHTQAIYVSVCVCTASFSHSIKP